MIPLRSEMPSAATVRPQLCKIQNMHASIIPLCLIKYNKNQKKLKNMLKNEQFNKDRKFPIAWKVLSLFPP